MAGRVVYDSDDSDASPPRSPAGMSNTDTQNIQSRPATPPRAMVALMEPSPLPQPVSTLHPTSSTDPSFFQNVYDEQQREIGAQLGQLGAQVQAHSNRDPWDVPSSPMQPPAKPADKSTDRPADKRRADHSSSNEPKRQKQKEHIEISIPLEPTPSMLHQYAPVLSSSSWGQSQNYAEVTHTLARGMAAYNEQQVPADPTQSTVAFPTPSMYASSGRRMGSSNDPVVVDPVVEVAEPELPATTHTTATPPRKVRAPLLMSSPDIIAGPAPEVAVPAPAPLPLQIQPEPRQEIDDSGSELSFHSSPGREPSPLPAPEPIPEKQATPIQPSKKAKKIIIIKKPAVIAASDDEDFDSGDDLAGGYHDVYAAPGSPQSGSDFEDTVSKKAPKAKKEKAKPKSKLKAKPSFSERTSNEVVSIELPDATSLESLQSMESLPLELQPAKRPRGRPKLAAKTEPKTEYKDSEESDGFDVSEAEEIKPKTKTAKVAKAKTKAKTKGKGRGKKVDDDELSTSVTALSETSGNAVPVSVPEKAEEAPPAPIVEEKEEEVEQKEQVKETPIPKEAPVKPAAGLSTGLSGLGGRVLYRVGLSKKTRIAPLLKIVRK